MFQTACQQLFRQHTILPIEIAIRLESGEVRYGISAAILVNADGWILTAGHVLLDMKKVDDAMKEANLHHQQAEEIRIADNLTPKVKRQRLKALGKLKPTTPLNQAVRIGRQTTKGWDGKIFNPADVGILKVNDFTIPDGYDPPCFRTEPLDIGEMVCRAGYPFYQAAVTWDEKANRFVSREESVPLFVNEGIVSRFMKFELQSVEDSIEHTKFIETSSPGLRGQSGGPLIDKDGKICGMQSHTAHYPLDFSPKKGDQTEHQFLNVGRAVHVDTIRWYLDQLNISYRTE